MESPRFRVMASSFFCDEPVNPCRNIERETLQSGDLHPLRRDLSKVQGLVFDSCNTCGLYPTRQDMRTLLCSILGLAVIVLGAGRWAL